MAQPSTTPTTAPTTTVPPGESLPRTGSNTGRLVAIGVGLLLAGGFLVMSAHRYGTGLVPAVAPAVQPVAPRPPIRSAGQPGSATGTTIFETWKRSRFGR